ncbi:MAG: protein phosphatase 2C domain-containing protein [Myxococcales bacterium]|nr:protein phosphatase 2C domain-containing protein [Myxococcales bacterium]
MSALGWGMATVAAPDRVKSEAFAAGNGGAGVFAVAEGMAGHGSGAVAAGFCALVVERLAQRGERGAEPLARTVHDSAMDALAWHARLGSDPAACWLTCAVAALDGDRAWVAHIGACRVARVRGGSLQALTTDHTLRAQLTAEGRPVPEHLAPVVVRALGPARPEERAEVAEHPLAAGDTLVLATGALWDVDEPAVIAACLAPAREAAWRLGDLAVEGTRGTVAVVTVRLG